MSKDIEEIGQGLNRMLKGKVVILPALVLEVNDDDTVKARLSTGLELDDVRMKSVIKAGNKVLFIPKVGSTIQVGRIENSDEYLVIAVEEITKIIFLIGGMRFEADENGMLLQAQGENLLDILLDLAEACIAERHQHPNGPTIKMTEISKQRFVAVKTRMQKLLKNA